MVSGIKVYRYFGRLSNVYIYICNVHRACFIQYNVLFVTGVIIFSNLEHAVEIKRGSLCLEVGHFAGYKKSTGKFLSSFRQTGCVLKLQLVTRMRHIILFRLHQFANHPSSVLSKRYIQVVLVGKACYCDKYYCKTQE